MGAAPGYEVRVAQWPTGLPPPPGAVVVGVSAKGDPLLAAVAVHTVGSSRCVTIGYASARENIVTFAFGGRVQQLPWYVRGVATMKLP